MKAIETRYKGYRFRSRLEARWAVFFDAVGSAYQYEPEGFDLGKAGYYLPDFFLPEIHGGLWIEVKPNGLTKFKNDEQKKIAALADVTGISAIIFQGDPMEACTEDPGIFLDPPGWHDGSAYWMHFPDGGADGAYIPCVCPWCGKFGVEFDGRGCRVCPSSCREAHKDPTYAYVGHPDKGYSNHSSKIVEAAKKARSARFEHGECPA